MDDHFERMKRIMKVFKQYYPQLILFINITSFINIENSNKYF